MKYALASLRQLLAAIKSELETLNEVPLVINTQHCGEFAAAVLAHETRIDEVQLAIAILETYEG